MSDDKAQKGQQDRGRVSAEKGYAVRYFAKKHSTTVDQAEQLFKEHGGNRKVLDAAAGKLKG